MEQRFVNLAECQKSSFSQSESKCEASFFQHRPFWHLTTNGTQMELIFITEEDYNKAMNIIAVLAFLFPSISIITFQIMSNHIHFILCGELQDVIFFFNEFKKRIKAYFSRQKRFIDWEKFQCGQPISINDLKTLRNEIVYVNRNGYVADSRETPYSYRWGSSCYYFSELNRIQYGTPFSELKYSEKRKCFQMSTVTLPSSWRLYEECVLPNSYCLIATGESFFRGGSHYFSLLSKAYEAYSETANRLRDEVFLSDEELYSVISQEAFRRYQTATPKLLTPEQKIEIARTCHTKYNASNAQLRRILKIQIETLDELFPSSKKQAPVK